MHIHYCFLVCAFMVFLFVQTCVSLYLYVFIMPFVGSFISICYFHPISGCLFLFYLILFYFGTLLQMSVWFFNESQKSMIWKLAKAGKIQKTYRRRNYNQIIMYKKNHFWWRLKTVINILKNQRCILCFKKEIKRLPSFWLTD